MKRKTSELERLIAEIRKLRKALEAREAKEATRFIAYLPVFIPTVPPAPGWAPWWNPPFDTTPVITCGDAPAFLSGCTVTNPKEV